MKLTFQETMQMANELKIFLDMMNTPDTRWDGVQDWLTCHPRWEARVKHYTTCTPDEAVADLKAYIEEKAEIPQVVLSVFISPAIEAQARSSIERLQTLYRERANHNQSEQQPEKEIKNVRRKRISTRAAE